MMIVAGFFDIVDGPVARKQERVTVFGGFLDSILDRYSDLILFLGLAGLLLAGQPVRLRVLAGIAMAGAVMVSYSRARAESLIGKVEVGFWERPERIVLMIICGAFKSHAAGAVDFGDRPEHHRDSPHYLYVAADQG